jgi:hypothetical protein
VGLTSATEFTSVTVNPPTQVADQMTVVSAVYRINKQRLQINITDNTVSPTLVLKLQPYVCQDGASTTCPGGIFTPSASQATFTNNGGGLYILTAVGMPKPACNLPIPGGTFAIPCSQTPLDVKSNFGGDSQPFRLTLIRQN